MKFLIGKYSADKVILTISLILSINLKLNIGLKVGVWTKWAKFINFKKHLVSQFAISNDWFI